QKPNDDGIVMQFPPPGATSGTFSGTVFLPDGTTPASTTVSVSVVAGFPLTVQTGPDGRVASPTPMPAGIYTLRAPHAVSTLTGETLVRIPAGGNVEASIRLLGRGSIVVLVKRPDGTLVPGATVTVDNRAFTLDHASGTTGADGTVRFTNLNEGSY